jgi:hypothetical protein
MLCKRELITFFQGDVLHATESKRHALHSIARTVRRRSATTRRSASIDAGSFRAGDVRVELAMPEFRIRRRPSFRSGRCAPQAAEELRGHAAHTIDGGAFRTFGFSGDEPEEEQ